jgi:hypothetical protein
MFSPTQRSKIIGDLTTISEDLDITFLAERRIIENLEDFPLAQATFNTEGRRQYYWRNMLHEFTDPITHQWETTYGNYSQATISISIRSLDLDELQLLAPRFATSLWKQACNWTFENTSKIEFRGSDPPRYLPPYLAVDERTNIYSCNIDVYVDYEFSWTVIDDPITNIVHNVQVGNIDNEDYADVQELRAIAPGCYTMNGEIDGNNYCLTYDVGGTIT